jgi:tyrosinase
MATAAADIRAIAAPLHNRRSADRLSPAQVALLRAAFKAVYAISDERGYGYWAGIHGLPLPIGCDNAHGTPYFLPWHRAYLYFFELALRDQVPDVALAWWDWRTTTLGENPGVPAIYKAARVDGKKNPLRSARVAPLALEQGAAQGMKVESETVRHPGAPGASPLPTRDEVHGVLALSDFLDFSSQVEDLHNRVHVWVGGHMGKIPFAAFDPIFWAHHTMIDRLWRIWQLRHGDSTVPASLLDEALPPFRMTFRQTLAVTSLGYDYASATRSVTVN